VEACSINIGTGLQSSSADVNEHVITYELGHAVGFRHSDYYNRAISCSGHGGRLGHELLLPLDRVRRVDQL
jgi:hypothetical protein